MSTFEYLPESNEGHARLERANVGSVAMRLVVAAACSSPTFVGQMSRQSELIIHLDENLSSQ